METSNMAYLNETSSVKTIVPGAEVSGFCDVVARQKINEVSGEVPQLSAGEGIGISSIDGKTVITNNISAGSNISLVYDMGTNTYRIDAQDGDLTNYYTKTETSSKQEISNALQYVSSNAGHTYTGVAPIQVNNTTNEISITGESISAGPGIDIFSSGGYVVISANGGSTFPITGTNGTTAYTHGADCSSFYLSNTVGRAGSVVTFSNNALNFASYPSTDVSASWYNIINGANNRSNCYCIRFTDDMTAASLEDYSAYDKVTIVHSNQYKPNCVLHWNGYTKTFTSGLYCEMVKGTNDQNQMDWFFTNSGRINYLEWDN